MDRWIALRLAQGYMARFVGLTKSINIPIPHSTFHSETELMALQLTYLHPLSLPHGLYVPRAYSPFPYPHGEDHQLKFSSPVTTLDSYANGAGKFHRSRQIAIFSIPVLCAYGGPT